MARTHRNRRTTRRETAPPWVWSVAGLIVGLLIAFLVYLQMRPQTPLPRSATPAEAAHANRDVRKKKDIAPPPAKPRFDFYNLLPEMEVIVPDEEIQGTPMPEGVKQVEKPGTYLLQAGSFRNRQQAEQLRAKLALLGLETSVQTISINSQQAWHRVRVGPFNNLPDLNDARALLKKNGVDAILIRLKG